MTSFFTEMKRQSGDLHNGGYATSEVSPGFFQKPRSVFWEQLFLDPRSEFRSFLTKEIFSPSGMVDLFPRVEFTDPSDPRFPPGFGCIVSTVMPSPDRTLSAEELADGVARVFATTVFFGMSDLHYENILIGEDNGQIRYFGPIDIEVAFERIGSLSSTGWFANYGAGICCNGAGLRALLKSGLVGDLNVFIPRVADSLKEALVCLHDKSVMIEDYIRAVPEVARQPIRVLLRATGDYVSLLKTMGENPGAAEGLLPEEIEQLKRGDVPYFFRFLDSPQLFFYRENFSVTPMTSAPPDWVHYRLRSFASRWSIDDLRFGHTEIIPSTFPDAAWELYNDSHVCTPDPAMTKSA